MTHRDKLLQMKEDVQKAFEKGEYNGGISLLDFEIQMMNINLALTRYPIDSSFNYEEYKKK